MVVLQRRLSNFVSVSPGLRLEEWLLCRQAARKQLPRQAAYEIRHCLRPWPRKAFSVGWSERNDDAEVELPLERGRKRIESFSPTRKLPTMTGPCSLWRLVRQNTESLEESAEWWLTAGGGIVSNDWQ
jgi:hypothetical protein